MVQLSFLFMWDFNLSSKEIEVDFCREKSPSKVVIMELFTIEKLRILGLCESVNR